MHASGWLHEEYALRSSSLVAQSCIGSNAAPTKIDFSSMDPALLGTGRWVQVRDQVDLLITDNWFDAHYPQLTRELCASMFDNVVPLDTKHRSYYCLEKPFNGYLSGPSEPGRLRELRRH
ncbi:hypothetical protein OsI_01633 [Oryza sativa Indica Group]|jgi:hypothetical protein|uniref:Uncharacterized protein n=1 Tax=Oryza sativa subsp. indica TaxID=39946 RepID=B8A733_ORYSI|nr:hypothetical protein OsI_01633 [Oryza sativa Indica Group]